MPELTLKNEKFDLCENHLFILKEEKKMCRWSDSRPKITQNQL
jgi:hypothetical protein